MIVEPTSDIVLDVLQAADPSAQRAAMEKLNAARSAGGDFGAALDSQAVSLAGSQASLDASSATMARDKVRLTELGSAAGRARINRSSSSTEVYRKFEAFVLQVFIGEMLPEGAHDVYGKGVAGGIWRSMLAEQLGSQLAKGGGIGIAKRLAAAHPPVQEDTNAKPGRAEMGARRGDVGV